MPTARRWYVCLSVCLFLSPLGCGPKLASVKGQVVFPDKSPLTSGLVVFEPADGNPYAGQGQIQSNGKFTLGTTRPGEGAHPGKYKVAIEAYDDAQPFDPRFSNIKTSGLEFTVTPGANDFTITVEAAKRKK
jgi:hypothetical protein